MDSFFTSYLKISALNKINTGNIFVDLFITFLTIVLISNLNLDFLKNIFENFFSNEDLNYELSLFCEEVKNYRGTRLKGTNTFKALLIHIKNKINKNEVIGLTKIKEYFTDKEYDEYDMNENDPIIFMCNQKKEFKLLGNDEPDICFKLICDENYNNDEDKKVKTKQYELKLIAGKGINLKDLQDYIELKYKNYIRYLEVNDENLYVFDFNGYDQEKKICFNKNKFDTTCEMENLFFENKDKLLKKIHFFNDNKKWYESKSKPYTLGICTYGPPGCGKTSFEKALAKMLNRHLIIVDISKIETKDEADAIFFSEKINDRIIPYDKRIYIFPDFDCQSDITKQRNGDISEETKKKEKDNVIIINQDQNQKLLENLLEKDKKDSLNLSKLLNILDGIPERTGQIMIFNTNHPEHLDKALLRPGRMDIIFKFDKIDEENSIKMIENYYEEKLNLENINIPNKKFTPAELFNILGNYDTINEAIKEINSWNNISKINY